MTTWSNKPVSIRTTDLSLESGDSLLLESGDVILSQTFNWPYGNKTKNTATWGNKSFSLSDYTYKIDSTYSFLIDDTYKLIIGDGRNHWSYKNKN